MLFNASTQHQQKLNQTEQAWQAYQQKEANLAGLSSAILLLVNGFILSTTLWFAAEADLGNGTYKAALMALFTFSALASLKF